MEVDAIGKPGHVVKNGLLEQYIHGCESGILPYKPANPVKEVTWTTVTLKPNMQNQIEISTSSEKTALTQQETEEIQHKLLGVARTKGQLSSTPNSKIEYQDKATSY